MRRLTISVRLVAIYALAIPLVLLALDVAEPFVWAPIVVFLAFPILFVVWLAFAFRSAVTSIFALRDRAWMRAIVFAIFPLVLAVFVTRPDESFRAVYDASDYVNLAIMQPWYDRDIAAARRAGRSFPIFYRQGMFGTMPFGAIVYDGSDEIALPSNRRSPAWNAHALKTELRCGFVARPLWSHYYRTDIDCSTLPIP